MKKLIILFSIVLFSAATVFAQPYHVKVTWNTNSSNCDCDASIGSKFAVYLRITDVANNVTLPSWSTLVDFDEFEYTFDVENEVKGHCNEPNNTYPPNYTIYYSVGFLCADTSPPELLCSDYNTETGYTCFEFGQGLITLPELSLD